MYSFTEDMTPVKPRRHYTPTASRCRRGGSVLIAVLAVVFLGTVLVYRFVDETVQELQYRGQVQENPELQRVAYSALETVLGVLHEIRELDGRLMSPVQGWDDPLGYADWRPPSGYEILVQIEDESGKIGLNTLDEERLDLLLELIGLDYRDAETFIDSFLDWQDADDLPRLSGAESDTYERENPPYRAANRPIQSWAELSKIEGVRDLLFDDDGRPNQYHNAFTSSVSLFDNNRINLHAANPLVLEYIARIEGFEARPLREHLDGRDGIRGTEDDRMLQDFDSGYYRPPEGPGQAVGRLASSLLRIRLWCKRGDAEFYVEILAETGVVQTEAADQHLPFAIRAQTRNLRIL